MDFFLGLGIIGFVIWCIVIGAIFVGGLLLLSVIFPAILLGGIAFFFALPFILIVYVIYRLINKKSE